MREAGPKKDIQGSGASSPRKLKTLSYHADYGKPIVAIFNNGFNIIFKHFLIQQMF